MARKRSRPRDDDEEDYADDEDWQPAKPRVRNNAYTGLLALSFLCLAIAGVLLYLDFESLSATIPQPSASIPELGASAQVPAGR
jgi:hypothetical protein